MFIFILMALLLFIQAVLGFFGHMPVEEEFKNQPWTMEYKKTQAKINAILGGCFLIVGFIVTYFVKNMWIGIALILLASAPCIYLSFKTKVFYLNKSKKHKHKK